MTVGYHSLDWLDALCRAWLRITEKCKLYEVMMLEVMMNNDAMTINFSAVFNHYENICGIIWSRYFTSI